MVSVGDRVAAFEVVHDARSGTLTVYAQEDPGKSLKLTSAPAVVLAGTDAPRVLTMARVPGAPNTWSATDPDLKGSLLTARLRVRVADKEVEGSLAPDEVAPAIPAVREEKFEPTHGGRVLMVAGKPFEWAHDPAAGRLTLYAVHPSDAQLGFVVADPSLALNGEDGEAGAKELRLVAVDGTKDAWRAEDAALKSPLLSGSFRMTIEGKKAEAQLVVRGEHGGRLLLLGADAPFLELKHDARTGTVTVFLVEPKSETYADSPAAFAEPPVLELSGVTGKKALTLDRVAEGAKNAWTVVDPALKTDALKGTIRVKIVDKVFEAKVDAPAPPRDDATDK
jgi:hypothetical protein